MEKIKREEKLFFLVILLFSFILRLFSLDQSFWLDEAVQVWASSFFSLKDLFLKYMPGDFNPPLYHFLLHFWIKALGTSEAAVRLFSVLLGIASVWLVWKIAEETGFSIRQRLIATLLLATSPLYIYYSQEARMYILASFGVVFSVWRFLIFLKRSSWRNSILFGLGILIMGFSHFLTLLALPVFIFGILRKVRMFRKASWYEFLKWIFPFAMLFLGYLLYLPLFLKQLTVGFSLKSQFPVWGQTVGRFSLKAAALLPVKFVIGRISIENKLIYSLVSSILVVVFWGLAILGGIKSSKLKVKSSKLWFKVKSWEVFFLFCLLLIPPVLGFLISFWVPVFSYFRFLFVLPFFYLLVAKGLDELKKLRKLVLIFLVGVNLICSGVYLFNPKFHREDWRGMVEWLQERNRYYGAPVLILSAVAKPFEYYDKGISSVIYLNPSDYHVSIHDNWEQVYLVSYGLGIFDPDDRIRKKLKDLGFKIWRGESFNRVGIEEWKKVF